MRRLATLAVAIAGLAALAGCGGTATTGRNFEGTERDVANVVGDLRTAGQRKDGERICTEILARSLVSRLDSAGTSCAQEMTAAAKDVDDFALDVRDVTVTGDRATATVRRGDDGPTATLGFVREANRWKISELSSG